MMIINGRISESFWITEFMCHCGCETVKLNYKLIDILQGIRDKLALDSLVVEVGYRCKKHNDNLIDLYNKGLFPNEPSKSSKHLLGEAADIKGYKDGKQVDTLTISNMARTLGASGIGTYNTFSHIDVGLPHRSWDRRTLPYKFFIYDNNHVIECNPENLRCGYNKKERDTYVSGMFYNRLHTTFHSMVSQGVVLQKRKSYSKYPTGCFAIQGAIPQVVVETNRHFEYRNIWFLINGANLDYEANGSKSLVESVKKEHHSSDILRYATHTAIGWNEEKGKVYLVVTKPMTGDSVRRLMRNLGCITDGNTKAILLDGSKSSKMVFKGDIKRDTTRKIVNYIYLE